MMGRGIEGAAERDAVLASPAAMGVAVTGTSRSVWRGLARMGKRVAPSGAAIRRGAQEQVSLAGAMGSEASRASGPGVGLGQVLSIASACTIGLFVLCALFPDLVAPHPPTHMQADAVLAPPGAEHWFGTDQFGRDVFSLVVFGARQSLLVGVSAVLVGCGAGVSIGLVAGYFGGWVDQISMRCMDVWLAVPSILMAIALSTALGPSLTTTILAIGMASVPRYARVLRGRALSVRGQGFVLAARASGASHWAILRGHVLPHCVAPALVLGTLGVGNAILMGSGLSFLGLGVNDDEPDWGYQLTQGRGYLTVAWWAVTYPGLALTALVVSVNVLGDSLRHRFEPRAGAAAGRGA